MELIWIYFVEFSGKKKITAMHTGNIYFYISKFKRFRCNYE